MPDSLTLTRRDSDRRPRKTERRNGLTLADRLERRAMPEPNSGCLLWLGAVNALGYGTLGVGTVTTLAHRAAWLAHRGPIPTGLFVCHKCDVPSCVNPDHLFVGTNQDNMADMAAKGRNRQPKGEKHGRAKLSADDALTIFRSQDATRFLVRRFGVSPALIRMIRRGEIWTSVTGAVQ